MCTIRYAYICTVLHPKITCTKSSTFSEKKNQLQLEQASRIFLSSIVVPPMLINKCHLYICINYISVAEGTSEFCHAKF